MSDIKGYAVGPMRFVVHFEVEVPPHVQVDGLEAEITEFVRQALDRHRGMTTSPVRPEIADIARDVTAEDLATTTWCGIRVETLNAPEAHRVICLQAKDWHTSRFGWEKRI